MLEIILKILIFLIVVAGAVFYYIKTKNAKYGTFRILIGVVLLTMVMSYLIKGNLIDAYGTSDKLMPIGFADAIINGITAINVSLSTILYLVSIGIFYAILKTSGSYESVVENTAIAYSKNKGLFIIISVLTLGLVTLFTGQLLVGVVFIPFLISVIRKLGYSKEISITSTVGAVLIGHAGTLYTVYLNSYLSLGIKDNILTKVLISVIGLVALLAFILVLNKRPEKVVLPSSKKSMARTISFLSSFGLAVILFIIGIITNISLLMVFAGAIFGVGLLLTIIFTYNHDSKTLLVNIFLYLMLVFVILGFVPWKDYFDYNGFEELLTSFREFKLLDASVFDAFVGSSKSVVSFGTWQLHNLGLIILLMSAFTYLFVGVSTKSLKISDAPSIIVSGIKKALPYALIVIVTNVILVNVFNSGTLNTITNFLVSKDLNLLNGSLLSILSAVFYPESSYAAQFTVLPLLYSGTFKDNTLYALLFQSVYSIALFVSPTSVILLGSLFYTKTSYKEWIKHIYLFVLVMMLVSLILIKVIPEGSFDILSIIAIAALVIAIGLIIFLRLNKKQVSVKVVKKENNEPVVKKIETEKVETKKVEVKKAPAKKTVAKKTTTTKKTTTKSKK